jgi:SAM-dependent methyltransferase
MWSRGWRPIPAYRLPLALFFRGEILELAPESGFPDVRQKRYSGDFTRHAFRRAIVLAKRDTSGQNPVLDMIQALLQRERDGQRAWIAALSYRSRLVHVAMLSGLGLFVELLLIRWLDAQVRPLGHVKNLPLIGSFLGLGIGFALSHRSHSLLPAAVPLLAATLAGGSLLAASTLYGPQGSETNIALAAATGAGQLAIFYLSIALVFALIVLCTIPLGQVAGAFMDGVPALAAYSANVAGAVAGIALVFALSFLWAPPWINALLAVAVLVFYTSSGRRLRAFAAVVGVSSCALMAYGDRRDQATVVWSPYNKIEVSRFPAIPTPTGTMRSPGWSLRVQNHYYQRLLDLRETPAKSLLAAYPFLGVADRAYNMPYEFKSPRKVLVVGAGTGNDVAAALRHGAAHVDAVEIDPLILRFGIELHPEHPYQDPRVRLIVDDARAFLKRPGIEYDMIVFGLLDSHDSLFSTFAGNIRLDNYVYTVEALRDVMRRLAPDGVFSLAFYVEQSWIAARLDRMLRDVTGRPPVVAPLAYDRGFLFLVGPGLPRKIADGTVVADFPDWMVRQNPPGPSAIDDWPFLYLRDRRLPPAILWASATVLLASGALILSFFRRTMRFDRQLFFLGAGFLLVETRTIMQLGLIFGSTWQVSGITIAAILTLILIANRIVVSTGSLAPVPLYGALALSLLANYVVPPSALLGLGTLGHVALAGFFMVPLFCAALIFATRVRGESDLAPALASNLMGSVLGGLLENLSLLFGVSALSLVALVIYAASFRRTL